MEGGDFGHLVISAPGKVIIHGEHAVVHGKRALACSLDLRTYLHVTRCSDGFVKMHLPDIGITNDYILSELHQLRASLNNNVGDSSNGVVYPTSDIMKQLCDFCGFSEDTQNTKELAVVAFIYLFITILEPQHMVSLDFMVSSNLPTSAGLGSSAAFAVSLVSSLLRLSNKVKNPVNSNSSFHTWDSEDLSLINAWAYVAEKIIHGNPSGVDNSVSTYGGLVKYQNKQLECLECKHALEVIITDTKVSRSTKKMVAGVQKKLDRVPTVMIPVMDAIEAVSALSQQQLTSSEPMDDSIIKECISDNQSLLNVLGVNHQALQNICDITAEYSLVSKLTGAGGGGCAFTYVPSGMSEAVVIEVMTRLQSCGYSCWKTIVGGHGVGIHVGEPSPSFIIPPALQERAKLCNIL